MAGVGILNFRFSILRLRSGQVLDWRRPESLITNPYRGYPGEVLEALEVLVALSWLTPHPHPYPSPWTGKGSGSSWGGDGCFVSISSPNPSECATPDVGDVRSEIIKRVRAGICWVLSLFDCIKMLC